MYWDAAVMSGIVGYAFVVSFQPEVSLWDFELWVVRKGISSYFCDPFTDVGFGVDGLQGHNNIPFLYLLGKQFVEDAIDYQN